MKRVLVTGGCGFIGSNLVPRLVRAGFSVAVLDKACRSAGHALNREEIEVIEGDVRDRAALSSAMAGAEAVVHLAASGSVLESVADPLTNFEHNAAGTLMTLEAARAQGKVDRFIFASTGGALIGNAPPPVHEGSLPRPISPYGASKLCGEAYCCAFAAAYGLHTVALRFANIYGPYSAHKRGAVTAFAKALMLDLPIVIYGSGQASRDFLHVDDLCTGIVSALLHDIPKGAALHLASGKETSIAELAKAMSAVAGKPEHPIEFRPERAGEVERNFGDFSLAKRLLGFEPSVPLQRGLQQTWAWFNEHGTWRD